MGTVYWGTAGAASAGINPKLLMLGDSWLWYPFGSNIAIEIGNKYSTDDFLVVGACGAEADDWINSRIRKEIDWAFRLYASGTGGLLLSGGGNDVAGSADLLRIIKGDCSEAQTVADCYQPGQPEAILASIIGACRTVILKFRGYNTTSPVYTHNYDYAWPSGKGAFGPADWLKIPMDAARVPEPLRRDLFRHMLDRLHEAQNALAAESGIGPVVVIRSAGTLPDSAADSDTWWANELHPTIKGFRRLARKVFIPAMKPVLGGS
jgi:hypothetical protein